MSVSYIAEFGPNRHCPSLLLLVSVSILLCVGLLPLDASSKKAGLILKMEKYYWFCSIYAVSCSATRVKELKGIPGILHNNMKLY